VAGTAGKSAIAAGLLLLTSIGGLLTWTGHAGTERAADTVQELRSQWFDVPDPTIQTPARSAKPTDPIPGQAFAIMTVPRFGPAWQMPISEGTGAAVLRGGLGHYPSTALPGAVGNFAVAGHRTTWGHPFREIQRLRTGDVVRVQTRLARFTYRITGHQIVRPSATEVLDPVPGQPGAMPAEAEMTLTTCHPEYSARQRWVVHAVLIQTTATF
jgi:sortase A